MLNYVFLGGSLRAKKFSR